MPAGARPSTSSSGATPRGRARRGPRADRARRGARRTGRSDARGSDRRGADRRVGRHAGRRLEHAAQRAARRRTKARRSRCIWALDADAGSGVDPSRGARSRSIRSSASSGCRRTSPASTRPRLRGHAAGTSTARSSSPERRSTSRSRSTERSSRPATGTRPRGTARSPSSRSRRPWSGRSSRSRCATISRCGTPIAWTPDAWLTFGFDEDLDEAAALAIDGMLELMGREHGLERREALALASVVVDLRVTQLVNGARGIHARLAHDALR